MNAHYVDVGGYELLRTQCPSGRSTSAAGEFVETIDNVIAAYGPWWGDFRASANLEGNVSHQCEGLFDPGFGMVFHLMDQGYYAFLLGTAQGKGKQLFFKLIKGQWNNTQSPLIPWTRLESIESPGKNHRLTVEYDGGFITLKVDDQRVGIVRDNTFPYGLVGFGVFDRGHLIVRDLRVEALQ